MGQRLWQQQAGPTASVSGAVEVHLGPQPACPAQKGWVSGGILPPACIRKKSRSACQRTCAFAWGLGVGLTRIPWRAPG